MYLRLASTPYAVKDDFELLASNLPVVGCMHPLVWFYTALGVVPSQSFMHSKQALYQLSYVSNPMNCFWIYCSCLKYKMEEFHQALVRHLQAPLTSVSRNSAQTAAL